MTEQEIFDNRFKILNLKQKLQYHFRIFSSGPDITNNIFYLFLTDLKVKYNDNNSIEFIERITNNLHNLSSSNKYKVDDFMRNICINNLNNEMLIRDLLNYVDMTRNYELEERIKNLEKDVVELKNINIEQSVKINENLEQLNNLSSPISIKS